MSENRKLVLTAAMALAMVACDPSTERSHHPAPSEAKAEQAAALGVDRASPAEPSFQARTAALTDQLPLRFEANAGQWDKRVRFATHARGTSLFATDDGVTIALESSELKGSKARHGEPTRTKRAALTMKLRGARPSIPRGEELLATKSNFFIGNHPSKWRTDVANYGRVRAHDVTPGVDMVWHGGDQGLEYDLEVAAGVDASKIVLEIGGADALEVDSDGALRMRTSAGTLAQLPPRVTQRGHELSTRYVPIDDRHVGFAIRGYDRRSAILIDPVLVYSTYLGGMVDEQAYSLASDSAGNTYISGQTHSHDFPTANGYQNSNSTISAAFISKLNPAGTSLVYSTYLAGANAGANAFSLAIDPSGDVYVGGYTDSASFPTLGAIQGVYHGGGYDAFLAKLSPAGNALLYSTYLGGNGDDEVRGVAIDSSGGAYITGFTGSTDFPTHTPFQGSFSGSQYDAFVAKINPAGSALVYSTYLGGSGNQNFDYPLVPDGAIAVDANGDAYVTGTTSSTDFPTHAPLQAALAGATDAFVTELDPTGTSLVFSSYLGGSGDEHGRAIALDSNNNIYLAGGTSSVNFPTQSPFQPAHGAGFDVFVTKMAPAGASLVYSTYLGGSADEMAYSIAVDSSNRVYLAGYSKSPDFPEQGPLQPALSGTQDAFVSELDGSGSSLIFSSLLGGTAADTGLAVGFDQAGNLHVAGTTASTDFPLQGPIQSSLIGTNTQDVFVTEIKLAQTADGDPCSVPGQCNSGFCADGVCCDSACSDQCAACDVAQHIGTCTVVLGNPHSGHPACDVAGACGSTCNGAVTAACTYPGPEKICNSVCETGVATASTCDNKGNCVVGMAQSCNNLQCSDDGTTCKTSCMVSADCASGYTCANGECGLGASCVDDHTAQPLNGASIDCTPYKCAGGCKTSCASVDDCASPNVCNVNGQCVPKPSTQDSGGCSIEPTGGDATAELLSIAVLASAFYMRERRRRATA